MSNNSMLVFFLIYVALYCNSVDASEECDDQINKFMEAWQETTKEGNAPECFQKYGLERFKGTGEEEEDTKKYKELTEYMETLSTEDQKNIKTCFHETGRMAAKKMEEQMSAECVEELKKLGRKWKRIQ